MNIRFFPMELPAEWAWMQARAMPIACADSQGIVAYNGDQIVACCVADSFTRHGCNVHIAVDNPLVLRHGFLQEVSRHLYDTCGRHRLFGLVPATNEKALKFDQHIGFSEIARIPDGFADGVDYVVLCMEREQCRWLDDVREAA